MNSLNKKQVSFVIPVYNEEANVRMLSQGLIELMKTTSYDFEIIFVDDGSKDSTLSVLKEMAKSHPEVFYIELSRNFGHQYALKAGLDLAKGDCVISLDGDMQHPPAVVAELIEKWNEGYDIVYTRRTDDANLPWLKRKTSVLFYRLLNALSDFEFEPGTADFRLMNRKAVDAFKRLNESELFIRGLVKWSGFKQVGVNYVAATRYAGKSKYNYKKMLSFALRGITSFSVKPLRMIGYLGMILFLISMVLVPYALISFFSGNAVSGWTSLIITVIFFGSLQLLMIGIIGFYLSKLVIQAKERPLYLIRDTNYPETLHQHA